ncbi:hypothetical protein CcrColossus_gp434 [Caulobacter phage CcrColossus]|uniref:Uncharacterized protein n=1 Tax=Caulobacter phage CcrColossus TaxID=1211640 RepID=K4JSI0_9CAUD|nr:hypothetical protein CcrColossus_gp434 [Caulobacter phage CcrColossus]AFU88304.1 hypothetical protein CcrColossus_gp434 [Caulobacter phage CcrColossus]
MRKTQLLLAIGFICAFMAGAIVGRISTRDFPVAVSVR